VELAFAFESNCAVPKVRVWKFTVFDMGDKESHALASRHATSGTIAMLGGKPITDSGIDVDETELENGMTKPGFVPRL
jgi:hypothetical protein